MALAAQWKEIAAGLAPDWADVRLRLRVPDEAAAGRVAALLGPLGPWRTGNELRLYATRSGTGPRPDAILRGLRRLDAEGIDGTLELVLSDAAPKAAPRPERPGLAVAWDALLATLPPDWSDLYLEAEFDSSDYLPPAALDMSPLNPRRGGPTVLRFRAASCFGYGASPGMVRRCLERCDRDGFTGELLMLRVLSDTFAVSTQGPVWYIGGRTV